MSISVTNAADSEPPHRAVRLLRATAVLYALSLTYLLLVPQPLFFLGDTGASVDKAIEVGVADWVKHAGVYMLLGILICVGFGDRFRHSSLAGIALLHSALCEVAQQWIPGREFAWSDLFANIIGVLAGVLLAAIWQFWSEWRTDPHFPGGLRF